MAIKLQLFLEWNDLPNLEQPSLLSWAAGPAPEGAERAHQTPLTLLQKQKQGWNLGLKPRVMYEEEPAPQLSGRSHHSNPKLLQCLMSTAVVLQIIFPARNKEFRHIKPVLWYKTTSLLYNIWVERQECNMQSHMTGFTVLPCKNLYYQHHMGDHPSSLLKSFF